MSQMYWFYRDYDSATIHVNFARPSYRNMNAFLNMARYSVLREVVDHLRAHPTESYRRIPGEYLELAAENGIVDARICMFEDVMPVRMPVGLFVQVAEEYLDEMDLMIRTLRGQ